MSAWSASTACTVTLKVFHSQVLGHPAAAHPEFEVECIITPQALHANDTVVCDPTTAAAQHERCVTRLG